MLKGPGCGAVIATIVIVATGLSVPVSAFAQVIEEITVTARKTEESLQDVPISISAFTGEQMRERGINNNYDVAAFTPNFTTSKRVGRDLDRPTIRGFFAWHRLMIRAVAPQPRMLPIRPPSPAQLPQHGRRPRSPLG